jgi:hypothetical protein
MAAGEGARRRVGGEVNPRIRSVPAGSPSIRRTRSEIVSSAGVVRRRFISAAK